MWWRSSEADPRRRQYIEHVRLEGFIHRTAVDLAILAMRQTAFLDTHATLLASTLTVPTPHHLAPETDPAVADTVLAHRLAEIEKTRTAALELELRLIDFRNDTWFTHVPGDTTVNQLLSELHATFGTGQLLADIDTEQRDLARILGLASTHTEAALTAAQHRAALAAEDAARATRASQARLEAATLKAAAELKKRRALLDKLITFAAPLIAVPGAVLAFIQVYQGSSGQRIELWVGSTIILTLCALSWAVLGYLLLASPPPPDNPVPTHDDVVAQDPTEGNR